MMVKGVLLNIQMPHVILMCHLAECHCTILRNDGKGKYPNVLCHSVMCHLAECCSTEYLNATISSEKCHLAKCHNTIIRNDG
jgi:hypothetical protein